jgi:hypothetical protein
MSKTRTLTFLELPVDILTSIANFLDVKAVLALTCTCKSINEVYSEDDLWHSLSLRDFPYYNSLPERYTSWRTYFAALSNSAGIWLRETQPVFETRYTSKLHGSSILNALFGPDFLLCSSGDKSVSCVDRTSYEVRWHLKGLHTCDRVFLLCGCDYSLMISVLCLQRLGAWP